MGIYFAVSLTSGTTYGGTEDCITEPIRKCTIRDQH